MAKKLKTLTDVLAAFEKGYPGPSVHEGVPWLVDWRSCYPQFDDAIVEKAGTIILADLANQTAANAQLRPTVVQHEPLTTDEMEVIRIHFVGLGDPTPDELKEWKASHPAMADELTEMAKQMSIMAYLRTPPLPLTRAEQAEAKRKIANLVAMIEAGTLQKTAKPPKAHSFLPPALYPTGRALRAKRDETVAHFQRNLDGRRKTAKAGGGAR